MTGALHAGVQDDAGAEFAAGYLWGTKAEDKRPYIMSCFKTDTDLNNILDQIMTDYSRGDVESGDKRWSDAEPKFQKAIKPCSEVSGEFKDLSDYAKNISKKTIKPGQMEKCKHNFQAGTDMMYGAAPVRAAPRRASPHYVVLELARRGHARTGDVRRVRLGR